MNWLDAGAGFFMGMLGRSLLKKLFKLLTGGVKGVFKTVLDATAKAFNEQVAQPDFDFKEVMETDFAKYKNTVTRDTWFKKYFKDHRYNGLLIQGQLYFFTYDDPATKDRLEYYDTTPLILSFGVYYAQTGNIVEYGINLHFLPLRIRKAFLIDIFEAYRKQYKNQMYSDKPRSINEFTWEALQVYVDKYGIDFAVRSYIQDRRKHTVLIRYEDWGKALNLPSSKFVGINDRELERRYRQHLASRK